MAVTFVVGRAGTGKTRYCLDALLSELDNPADDRRLILLVPEQASFQMERTLATRAARGGYTRAEVLSFSRLAQRVLGEVGEQSASLRPEARSLALRCAARRMGKSLRFYRDAAQTSGFYAQLDRLIEELLHEQVTPRDLAGSARALADSSARRKVAEIARLYREYLEWLGPERIDPAARLAALRSHFTALPWLPDASIWVDGFAGFTGQELATLAALARAARHVTITLLLDPASRAVQAHARPPDPLNLFQRTELTYQRLLNMFAEAGVECRPPVALHPAPPPRFTIAPALARLEGGLATPIGVPLETPEGTAKSPPTDVTLLECATHRDELRQAARFIRRKILDSGGRLRFRDFALIARDLEPFAQTVAGVFTEYDIPHFLDRRRPMRSHPLSRLCEALFAAVSSDFSVAAMTRLLRTGLLPLTRGQVEELENTVVAYAVHGVGAWRQPTWDFSRDRFDEFARSGTPRIGNGNLDAARLKLLAGIEPLLNLAQADSPPTGAVWARTLHDVLESLGIRQRVETWIAATRAQDAWERAETHRLAWETLSGALQDLHDVLGAAPLWVDEAASILAGTLREQTLGLAPPTLDQVLVSEIERSRHPDITYAWVFAFNEGVFPARPAGDELLGTTERDTLTRSGLPAPASHRDEAYGERLLAYIACTRPSCGLTISYAQVGEDGSPLPPSPLLDDVKRALPELNVQCPEPDEPPVCLTELAREYLRLRPRRMEHPRQWRRCERLCSRTADADRLSWLLRGRDYRNQAQSVGSYRPAGEEGVVWSGSPSEVETWLDCSFKHFARYGLRLDAARDPRPVSWDLGSIAHHVLADVTRRAMQEPGGVREVPDERWQTLLRDVIDDFKQELPTDLSQRRPELVFLCERLYAFVAEVITVHAERWRRGTFEPLACEQPFEGDGGDAAWPALELRTADGQRALLRGKIDRVDQCRDDNQTRLLVYDYKSSTSPVGGELLTGARLQLFSYLLAVRQNFGAEEGAHVAGVFLAPLYPDLAALKPQYAAAASEREQRMYMYRPRGKFAREVATSLDAQLGQAVSPVAGMKLKKNGDFDRTYSRDVVSLEEIERRLELARRTVLLAAEGIVAGRVEVAPLVESHTLACRWCDFRPLCRFDRALNRPRAAEAVLPRLGQVPTRDEGEPS